MSDTEGDGRERLAPVTYLPGAERSVRWAVPLEQSAAEPPDADGVRPYASPLDPLGDDASSEAESLSQAEDALARRLRHSALSAREARAFLLQRDFDVSIIDVLIDRFTSRGWIDDAALAEQLVYIGTSRKSQGRRAIALTLGQRGIPREIVDAALASLPDDDAERALEYARTKAYGLRDVDFDTALRRLMAQIGRRGYSGSIASSAARTALTEQRGIGGVRFR